ncbi:MAG TPA: metallophosphatase domain-containing protein [Herpetosiphonaceae bacterium]
MIRIVAISDTHGQHELLAVPDGDILVHAGDLTLDGVLDDVRSFNAFLGRLPHRHKLVIAGNHDWCFEREPARAAALLTNATYLCDSAATIAGLRCYGTPWTPLFHDWAFMLPPGPALRAKWDLIPAGVDLLLTHGPPRGHGDRTIRGADAGCADLLAALDRVRPPLHVFGHIHEGRGVTFRGPTACVNASICTFRGQPLNQALVFDFDEQTKTLSREG